MRCVRGWFLLAGLVVGCHGDPVEPAAVDSGAVDAGSEVVADAGLACPYVHGSKMVRIDATAASYCIDTTEVTVGQFNEFLLDPARPFDAPDFCKSFADGRPTRNVVTNASYPQVGVAWCWAFAYCKWAGKRLCRRIGSADWEVPNDGRSEWVYACQNGVLADRYPYGDTYQASACNTNGGGVKAVGTSPACHGIGAPFDQVMDMMGNAGELDGDVGFLTTGEPNSARARGYTSVDGDRTCGDYADFGFGTAFPLQGFRCCDDP